MFHYSFYETENFLDGLHIACVSIAAAVLLTGIALWLILPQWRTFYNYLLTNTVLVGTIYMALRLKVTQRIFENDPFSNEVYYETRGNFVMSYCCWLLLMSLQMYADLVKVFYQQIRRKRLLSAVFAWGLPAALTTVKIILLCAIRSKYYGEFSSKYDLYFKVYVMSVSDVLITLLLLVNLVMYMWVLNALRKGTGGVKKAAQAATFAFVMSGAMMLVRCGSYIMFNILQYRHPVAFASATAFTLAQITLVNAFFLLLKPNRKILLEYLQRRRSNLETASDLRLEQSRNNTQ